MLLYGRYQVLDAARPAAPQRARDLQTAQTVLLREVPVRPDRAETALAHARAATGIFHPSLVTLFDAQPLPGDRLLLAYEFVASQPILQMSGGHPFNSRRAAEIVTEIADAVAELHAHDVVHGAISQATVLVTMKGKAKLDRVADPSLEVRAEATAADDLAQLGELLASLTVRTAGGVAGQQAVEAVIERARLKRFESAATLAAMLRRI